MRGLATAPLLLVCAAVGATVHGCAIVAGIEPPNTDPAKQHCVDGIKDYDERDIDCGGKDCLACGGAACTANGECQSGGCSGGLCVEPNCSDGVFDGYESSLDCGDPRGAAVGCPLCDEGVHCYNGCNCATAYCDPTTNACGGGTPNCDSCADGVEDGEETDIDCGGPTMCPRCLTGQKCMTGSDCASGACPGATCT
jgi:hypothetical protein